MPKKALVFAGQGAQFVGMGKDLAEAYPDCCELYEKADDILGYGLSNICFEGPEDELTKSNHCQPAIFVSSMACYRAYTIEGGDIDFAGMAGLSLGEWTALHAAGVLSFEDTVKVLEARGRFMQEACEQKDGAMVSVMGLDQAAVKGIASEACVSISNLNSAEQTVLAGERASIEKADQLAQSAGAKRTVVLNVAGAYHSPLMAPAAEKLAAVLEGIEMREPNCPVPANATGVPHGDVASIKETMLKQVHSTVKWLDCVQWFLDAGVDSFLECGPGRVLSGLIKRIDRSVSLANIQDVDSLKKVVNAD